MKYIPLRSGYAFRLLDNLGETGSVAPLGDVNFWTPGRLASKGLDSPAVSRLFRGLPGSSVGRAPAALFVWCYSGWHWLAATRS